MAYDVAALNDYTKENEQLLVTSSVLGAKTAALIKKSGNVMVGVKSAETINIMDTDAVFQSGASCGFNASGTTTFTQRPVTIAKLKVNEALCPKNLERTYLQKALAAGSMYDSIVFAQEYTDRKVQKIADQLEEMIWQGTASATSFDGFAELVASGYVDANTTQYLSGAPLGAITDNNVIDIFDAVYKAIPSEVVGKDDMTIFCGQDVFRTYIIALKNANQFHYTLDVKADSEFILPGTPIKVIATPGLNGTSNVWAMRLSNMFLGTDLLNEEEKFELFYAKEADQVRFVAEWKMGVNVAFPSEVVRYIPD
jgi:hypothetical protein